MRENCSNVKKVRFLLLGTCFKLLKLRLKLRMIPLFFKTALTEERNRNQNSFFFFILQTKSLFF